MARLRPCLGYPGHRCGVLTRGGRCPECSRIAKPGSTERGYDADHQRQRAALKASLPAYCWAGCGRWLEREGDWVAAHVVDGDPSSPRVATCRSCNERMKRR